MYFVVVVHFCADSGSNSGSNSTSVCHYCNLCYEACLVLYAKKDEAVSIQYLSISTDFEIISKATLWVTVRRKIIFCVHLFCIHFLQLIN